MATILLAILVLLAAIPAGLVLAVLTKDEKPIYKKYFPAIMWLTAIAAAVFYTLDATIALTLTFILITLLIWSTK